MTIKRLYHLLLLIVPVLVLFSCASTNMAKYYNDNKTVLDTLETQYKAQYDKTPFSIAFTDKNFKNVGIEILTDSIKYIYEFGYNEPRIKDTLTKYRLDAQGITDIIATMRSIKCIWINNLDYFVNERLHYMVYMSIRAKTFNIPFTQKRYNILAYFSRPQYYDSKGRLLTGRRERKIRKVNADVFKKITDKVCYTVSNLYR